MTEELKAARYLIKWYHINHNSTRMSFVWDIERHENINPKTTILVREHCEYVYREFDTKDTYEIVDGKKEKEHWIQYAKKHSASEKQCKTPILYIRTGLSIYRRFTDKSIFHYTIPKELIEKQIRRKQNNKRYGGVLK